MGAPSKIDRLIELGLSRYGAGDLEGALLVWEEALAIDPQNAQANSYVDYVRLHFEMLRGEPEVASTEEAPFGIVEEPEYQIEITDGDLPPRESPPALESAEIDAGWFDEEVATHEAAQRMATVPSGEPEAQELEVELPEPLELEAELPEPLELEAELPEPIELEAELPPAVELPPEAHGIDVTRGSDSDLAHDGNFEDATREYFGGGGGPAPTRESDFADSGATGAGTSDFQQEYTGGFTSEGSSLGFSRQETEIKKRDLGFVQPLAAPVPVTDKPSGPVAVGAAPTMDNVSLGTSEKTFDRGTYQAAHAEDAASPDEDDLLATLPNPRRPDPQQPETQDIPIVQSTKAVTKEMPGSNRRPASRDSSDVSQAEVMLNHSPTQDFNPARVDISAPTRELGLRPRPRPPSKSDPDDEDAPTREADVRAIREAAARGAEVAVPRAQGATQSDVALPFDPIDARAAEILEDVDADAPADEPHDERTRRRFGALIERALAWLDAGDAEKAVSAVDLAMSEDPNSALGQKLITRHRDTILSVFQGYIGDLERMPQLARPLHELQDAPISPRAAFLLSRVDGTLTVDELLDVSGMPRLEAYRHLCQLCLRGILR